MAQYPLNVNMEGVSIIVLTSSQFQYEVVGDAAGLVEALNARAVHGRPFQTLKTPESGLIHINIDHIVRVIDGPIGGLA